MYSLLDSTFVGVPGTPGTADARILTESEAGENP
jgi:hypothetical protein